MKIKSNTARTFFIILLAIIMMTSLGGLFSVPYFDPQIKFQRDREAKISEISCIPQKDLPAAGGRVHLELYVNGEPILIPKGIGESYSCTYELSTADASGTILVAGDALAKKNFTLAHFFALWGMPFSESQLGSNIIDANHILAMSVNGNSSREFGSLLLRDGQNIRIDYTGLTEDASLSADSSVDPNSIPPEILEKLKAQAKDKLPPAQPSTSPNPGQ